MSEALPSYKNIAAAIVATMSEIKGVEKNADVGTGNSSYKGVKDKDVKDIIRKAMIKNKLSILPINIEVTSDVERWEEKTQYGPKQKKEVFTRAHVTYRLLHESGEYIDIQGTGHGIDSQDKSAGKATTYALKYALLYTFLVPTGDIDDADDAHSDELPVKPVTAPEKTPAKPAAPKVPAPTLEQAFSLLRSSLTVQELESNWRKLPAVLKKDNELIALGTELKASLTA